MSTPYYGPNEPQSTIELERFFLAGDFITGFGYGIQFILWAICARYLWLKSRRGKQTTLLLSYITLLLVVETIYSVVQARTVELMYIDNRNYPGGPWQYFLDTQNLPVNVIFIATLFLITFMCDLLVFWRSWVIWSVSSRTTTMIANLIPFLTLTASFVMGVLWTLQSSHPGLSLYSKEPLAFGTAYYTLSLGTNIILTALIVVRLLMYRRTYLAHLPAEHALQYLSIATLIIESAALYSAFAIAFLVSYALNKPINQAWLGFAQAAQQVATYLIIYRVADGTAWSEKTGTTFVMSTIQFESGQRDAVTTDSSLTGFDAGRHGNRDDSAEKV